MTNLQSLSVFMTDRLMQAAQEIFKAVEVTFTGYHDEISRSRQENELLKTRLLEAGIPVYPELQPGLAVFHGEPCVGPEKGDPSEKIQVKQEPSVSREEPRVPPPQTSMPEEPMCPASCLEDEQRIEEMLHPQMTDSSVSPLHQAHQCMQIKEETDDLKSDLRTEIFCVSQSITSDDPSSAVASNHASELETELDGLSSMHNASKMPLSSKEKTARHRQRVNSDPKARAAYLARRKESYRRRKQLGKIKYIKSSDLPKTERKKQRAQWRDASRSYRERKKTAEAVFNFIAPSMEITPPILDDVDANVRAHEQSANTGPALADPLPLKEEFSSLHWCPPDQMEGRESIPQLRNPAKKLQREKLQLGKQYT